ncbi:MAG TPA: glycosyltransferase family 4 protein [Polyangia bacterium]|nr:glycosyltransferase family 4 protein [Polyangia bacterium]
MSAPGHLRFVIVSPNFFPRTCGVGDYSMRLAAELGRRGHDVTVMSWNPAEPHPEAPQLPVVGVDGARPVAVARRLAAAIAARRPTNVIMGFTAQMWGAWRFGSPAYAWLAHQARRAGARVSLVAHEPFFPWSSRPDLMVASALQRLQLAATIAASDDCFVTTESRVPLFAPLCRLVGRPAPLVIRIGANALPMPNRADPDRPKIGLFSTAAAGKRLDVLLDAFAIVAPQVPRAELVFIGDLGPNDQPTVRALIERVRRHPAADRIRITGKLPLAGVARGIAELAAYLFPMDTGANTRSGTLPVALGSGVPVVATRGLETDPSLFRDGENVMFASGLEGQAFAKATLQLLQDPALAARIGAGGRDLYARHLAWDRIADQLLDRLTA